MKPDIRFVVTCEHAADNVPKTLQTSVRIPRRELSGHRGYDKGALAMATTLSKFLQGHLFYFETSRLLIDANRSLGSRQLFSEFTRNCPETCKSRLIDEYQAYREKIFTKVALLLRDRKPVVAVSVHSFIPEFKGRRRKTEIGLLFRPDITKEKQFAQRTKRHLQKRKPDLAVHFNRPYRGHTDCLLNDLSDRFLEDPLFVGLFLEFNQNRLKNSKSLVHLARQVAESLLSVGPTDVSA